MSIPDINKLIERRGITGTEASKASQMIYYPTAPNNVAPPPPFNLTITAAEYLYNNGWNAI